MELVSSRVPASVRVAVDTLLGEYRRFADERAQWEFDRSVLLEQVQQLKLELTQLANRQLIHNEIEEENRKYKALFQRLMEKPEDAKDILEEAKGIGFKEESGFWGTVSLHNQQVRTEGKHKLRYLLEQMGYHSGSKKLVEEVEVAEDEAKKKEGVAVSPLNPAPAAGNKEQEKEEVVKSSTVMPKKGIVPSNVPAAQEEAKDLNAEEEEKLNKEVTVDFSKASNEEMAAALKELKKSSRKKKVGAMEYKPFQAESSWKVKQTLRGHLDGVRCVHLLEKSDGLLSASEDGTAKLWNAETGQDIVSFYGHAGLITSLLVDEKENTFYTGSADSSIIVWDIPDLGLDPYGAFGNAMKFKLYSYDNIHSDVIWDIKAQYDGKLKFSASADGTVAMWKYDGDSNAVLNPLIYDLNSNGEGIIPTSIAPLPFDNHKIAVSYRNGHVLVYDLERAVPVTKFIPEKEYWATKLIAHPQKRLLFSAGHDGTIQYLDHSSGQVVEQSKAHTAAITAMTLDQTGDTLISACHEASIRFWNVSTRKCEFDIAPHQTHRKKYGESIHALSYHSSKALFASAGADGIIKTFST